MPSDKDLAEQGTSAPAASTNQEPQGELLGTSSTAASTSQEPQGELLGTSSPTASTSQEPQAEVLDVSEEPACPVCWHAVNREACVTSCTHCFCLACIEDWSHDQSQCSRCRRPLRHTFPRLGFNCHEVQYITNQNRRRLQGRWARRRCWRSSGHWYHSNASRDRGSGQARAQERSRSRSVRRDSHHRETQHTWGHARTPERNQNRPMTQRDDSHRQAQHSWGYNSFGSRRQQRRRAWNNAHNEDRAPRLEWDVIASSGSSQHGQQAGWDSSRQWYATRNQSQRRSRSNRGRPRWENSQGHWSRQRWQIRDQQRSHAWQSQRSRSHRQSQAEGPARRHDQDVPAFSGRNQSHWRSCRARRRARWRQQRRRE